MRNGPLKVKQKSSKKAKKIIRWVAIGLLGMVACFSGYKIVDALVGYRQASGEYEEIKDAAVIVPKIDDSDDAVQYLTVDDGMLLDRNEDYAFWIDIPGTKLSYPVVYAADYEEYIHTTFDGKQNASGTLFIDFGCKRDLSSKNTIVYGHNMYDGSMFNTLRNYTDETYFNEHDLIYLYRNGKAYVYKAFAFFETTAGSSAYAVDFANDDVFASYLNEIVASSWYAPARQPGGDDSIITLSTCSRDEGDYRWVLFAMRIDTVSLG